jgi:hypothetical protein
LAQQNPAISQQRLRRKQRKTWGTQERLDGEQDEEKAAEKARLRTSQTQQHHVREALGKRLVIYTAVVFCCQPILVNFHNIWSHFVAAL